MKNEKIITQTDLVQASKKGVLIYQGDKLSSPEEISYLQWAGAEMSYRPEFIVKDENGEVTEVWFGEDGGFAIC